MVNVMYLSHNYVEIINSSFKILVYDIVPIIFYAWIYFAKCVTGLFLSSNQVCLGIQMLKAY